MFGFHKLSRDCEKCSRCGTTRQNAHLWDGCKCSRCGRPRDEEHDWGKDCEKCSKCGKSRYIAHEWTGCKCSKCGATRDESHEWIGDACSKCGTTHSAFDTREAAKRGDLPKLKELLRNNRDLVFSKDYRDWTPLHRAAYEGQKEASALLLAHGADVNATARDGYTPAHSAALGVGRGPRKEVVEVLLASKANTNAKTRDGMTPLHIAAFGGNKDLIQLLLPGTKVDQSDTALHLALLNTMGPGFERLLR